MKLARIGLPADDPSFVRAKTLHDGEVVLVGSANFDVRSSELNFVTVATVYDKAFASEILKTFKTPLYLIALSWPHSICQQELLAEVHGVDFSALHSNSVIQGSLGFSGRLVRSR